MPETRPAEGDTFGAWIRIWDVLAAFALLIASFLVVRLEVIPHLYSVASDKGFFSRRLVLLDQHRSGYSFETVRDHLKALGEEGRSYYAHSFIPVFDLALSLFLLTFSIVLILYATQPGKPHALHLQPLTRRLLLVPPIVLFLLDVGENLALMTLMTDYPHMSASVVERASMFTELKWLAVFITGLVSTGLAVHLLYKWCTVRTARQAP